MNKLLELKKKKKGDDREWHSVVLLCCAWRDLGWGLHVNVTSQLILSHFPSFLQALYTQPRFSPLPKSCRGSASADLRQNLNDLSVKPPKPSGLIWISAIWIMWVKRVTVSSRAKYIEVCQVSVFSLFHGLQFNSNVTLHVRLQIFPDSSQVSY